jgi:hypothetical protein
MGDIDSKAVAIACAKRLSKGKDNTEAAIICSEWDDEIRNPSWYPFRVVMVDGKETVWRLMEKKRYGPLSLTIALLFP